jgi:hypothetical protein
MAMAKKSPFARVTDLHGTKEKLVDKIVDTLERGDEDKEALKTRLQTSSNTKLLRLLANTTEVRDRFGSTEKLVDAILATMRRHKDVDYRQKLLSYSPARLLDLHRSREAAGRRAARPR